MGGINMPVLGALAGQQAASVIVPSQIPNLNLWYDASVATTTNFNPIPTNGGVVTAWIDKQVTGRDANQSTATRKPLWRASQQNGLGTIQFDGTNDSLTLNPIPWSLSLSGQTTFIVVKTAAIADQMHVMATNTGGFTFNISGTNWAIETGGAIAVSNQAASINDYAYMGMIFDGTQTNANTTIQNNARVKFRYNGVEKALTFSTNANTTTSAAANTLNVGANEAGNGGYLNGYIGELMIWTRKLSALEIASVETYLKNKWGIQDNAETSNLVLYYDPSIPGSYSGSGTTLTDLSGNGRNGTMSNTTYTSPYLAYNGSSSQVTIADNALLEPGTGDWTIEVWVNQTVASGSQVILGKFDPGGTAADVTYAVRVIGGIVRSDWGNGSSAVTTANYALPTGTWTQLVYVFNNVANNNIITYVNGVQQYTTTHSFASILNTTANLYLGSYNGGEYSQYFNGKIGITRLYSSALTSAQVLQNYNADKRKYGL